MWGFGLLTSGLPRPMQEGLYLTLHGPPSSPRRTYPSILTLYMLRVACYVHTCTWDHMGILILLCIHIMYTCIHLERNERNGEARNHIVDARVPLTFLET